MLFFFDSSENLSSEFSEDYSKKAKLLIQNLSKDKNLSRFDTFNKRFKLSWGMQIEFNDNLPITREDTRACYMLMLKISDLWFAFEHLLNIAYEVIPKDASNASKVNPYKETTLEDLGFSKITANFNELLYSNVLHKESCRKEIYIFLSYLKNNTQGSTQKAILDTLSFMKEKKELQVKHIFSLAYGIRNLYVHLGVAAALGGRDYQVKKNLYWILYDSLVLYSLALGNCYCCEKIKEY